MTLVPPETTRAIIEHEFQAVQAWANRHGWTVTLDLEDLVLTVDTVHPADDGPLRLIAELESYKAIPPAWEFVDPRTGEASKRVYPAPGKLPGVASSIFHGQPCLCAPFNRLAFKANEGPHTDWGEPTDWLDVDQTKVRATDLGSMLQVIKLHLSASPGRMA